jgi:hypothetical protein
VAETRRVPPSARPAPRAARAAPPSVSRAFATSLSCRADQNPDSLRARAVPGRAASRGMRPA